MLGLEPLTAWRGKGEPPGSAHLPFVLRCGCKELESLPLSRWGSQGLLTAFAALWTRLPLLCLFAAAFGVLRCLLSLCSTHF